MKRALLLPAAYLALAGCSTPTQPLSTAEEPPGEIDPSAYGIGFGEIPPGESASRSINLRNDGGQPVTVTSVRIEPLPPEGWEIRPLLDRAFMVLPGVPQPLSFLCAPNLPSTEPYTGEAVIRSDAANDPELRISLRCEMLLDEDGDGFISAAVGGDDCDDGDPRINPLADEIWYDGVDQNCDGANDFDQDDDGFVAAPFNADPNIYAGERMGGGDCQDNNDTIWPDHINFNRTDVSGDPLFIPNPNEVWYDGIDSNCDLANDFDQDGDGYGALAYGKGSDCDDGDATINTAAFEMLNAVDDDCDGGIDQDVPGWNSDASFTAPAAGERFGHALLMADLNQDGYDDILVGSPGSLSGAGEIMVFDGERTSAVSGALTFAEQQNRFSGVEGDGLGSAVAFYPSINVRGHLGVGLGASSANDGRGAVWLMTNEVYYNRDLGRAELEIVGERAGQQVGGGLASDVELNGDGVTDLLGHYYDAGRHALWLKYGGELGAYGVSDVDATYTADDNAAIAQRAMGPSDDLDGDGYEDVVFCSQDADQGGQVWILWGAGERDDAVGEDLGEAGTLVFSGKTNQQMGRICGISPDYTDDKKAELWVQVVDASGQDSGIYMVAGSDALRTAELDIGAVYARRYRTPRTDPGAINVGLAGDWDDDGISDMAFGMARYGRAAGRVVILGSDAPDGDYTFGTTTTALVVGDSSAYQERLGAAISPLPGDINKDGHDDFIIGDPGLDRRFGDDPDAGALFISYQRD
ncbi:MAG: MopE-related protein [Myxococcota bacterium]